MMLDLFTKIEVGGWHDQRAKGIPKKLYNGRQQQKFIIKETNHVTLQIPTSVGRFYQTKI